MQYDLYILVYFDCGHPNFLSLALPLIGVVIMAKLYIDCFETNQGATYRHNK